MLAEKMSKRRCVHDADEESMIDGKTDRESVVRGPAGVRVLEVGWRSVPLVHPQRRTLWPD